MPSKLNLFPVRAPIGKVTDANGNSRDVLMTPEFARALADLMVRVGGPSNFSTDELAVLSEAGQASGARIAALQNMVLDLSAQLASALNMNARLAAVARQLEDVAKLAYTPNQVPTDWEHPGKIGAAKANTAEFTTVKAVTLNKLTFTPPANNATYTLADGKTFTVTNSIALAGADGKTLTLSNTLGLSGSDGAFLNIGAGGTLGSAAFQSSSAFAARSGTALSAVATDPASTQALANSLRSVLLSVGIGT
jgi:hypothetical protein